ncbi:MAG: hypothetical protein AAGI17_05725 [Planctomycetota bacterium]
MQRAFESSQDGFFAIGWEPDAVSLLDDAHLVADHFDSTQRNRFVGRLQTFLAGQRDSVVYPLFGQFISTLDDFCHQLERVAPVDRLDRRIDGLHGVTNALRQRDRGQRRSLARSRYFIWSDADHCLRNDPGLFADIVDAMAGVAAEAEFASEDLLMIQRTVFIGGPALAEAAQDPRGPLSCWREDRAGKPFWQVLTGLQTPPIRRASIADIVEGRAGLDIDAELERLAHSDAI